MSKFTKTIAGIASAVALVASLAGSASAYTFSTNLTVGSSGADVSALQSWLIGKGYSIPAGATGYFGAQTKAAVAAFQTASGISPAAGYFGPITMAAVNAQGGSSVSMTPGCAAGAMYSSTTGAPCASASSSVPGCAAGAMYSSTTGASCSTGSNSNTVGTGQVMDGSDGSITISTSPYVTTSQTLKKGDTKDIYAVDLQAISGPVTINRFDVHFDIRPWLVFSQLVLHDSTGKVIATKTLNSASDATEITTGSDYMVRFDNVNYTVQPGGADTILIVNASVLASSDKITGQTVHVQVPVGAIRTINGKGYTDSLGLGTEFDANEDTLVLSSTGSTGDLYTRIDPSTPDTSNQTISTTDTTPDEVLGVFGVKTQNQDGVINGLTFNINNSNGFSATTLFQNVRVYDGSTQYGATSLSAANPGVAVFTNLNIPLTQDTWKSLTLKADVLSTSTAFSASSTMLATGGQIVGTDVNYNTLTYGNTSNITSNDTTFIPNGGITISDLTSNKPSCPSTQTGVWTACYPQLGFTVTNNGNNPIYLSKNANLALATTTSSGPNASSTVTSVVASGSTTGDSSAAYIVNVGASRTFTYNYTVDNTDGTTAGKKLSITQINYGTGNTDGTDNTLNVNFNLQNLYVQTP